jgi:hypothetical protein
MLCITLGVIAKCGGSVGLSSNFTYDCPLSVGMSRLKDNPPQGFVGFCWQVTIANQSAARVTIVYDSTIPSAHEADLDGAGALTVSPPDRGGVKPARHQERFGRPVVFQDCQQATRPARPR